MANATSPLYVNPQLSGIAIKYRQDNLIAERVLPRVQVDTSEFKHLKDRMSEWTTPVGATEIGRSGDVRMIGDSHQDPFVFATTDRALGAKVPNRDQMNGPTESALGRAVQRIMMLVELSREIRVGAVYANSANYKQATALSGTSQWSAYSTSDPVDALMNAMDVRWMRPNVGVCSLAVATKLRNHPKIIAATKGVDAGIPTMQEIAALFGLREIIVGQGWYNAAAAGQAANHQRVWPNIFAAVYLDPNAGPDSPGTWGYTAQFGERVALTGDLGPGECGLWGGVKVVAGESVVEIPTEPEFGILFSNVVA